MSNHFSAANLKSPGDDARLDLTDLFVFQAPIDPDKTVLIIDANPFMAGSEFHPDAVYRINIDNDGDAHEDASFSFVFSAPEDGKQTAKIFYAVDGEARQSEPGGRVLVEALPVGFDAGATPVQVGRCRFFCGVRSDPFFADAEGFLHGFQWTGQDTFANTNVLSIASEIPNDMLGSAPTIGVWATVSLRRNGVLVQMDRGGNPSINPIINPDSAKDEYNTRHPADDLDGYLKSWSELLQDHGYAPDEAVAAARTLLPDILQFNRQKPATYPNGRGLTDDVFSDRMSFLTHGQVQSDGLHPHTDLLKEFPFLGVPNPMMTES
jgi:hypothetical protein